jgi:hypothetical protein
LLLLIDRPPPVCPPPPTPHPRVSLRRDVESGASWRGSVFSEARPPARRLLLPVIASALPIPNSVLPRLPTQPLESIAAWEASPPPTTASWPASNGTHPSTATATTRRWGQRPPAVSGLGAGGRAQQPATATPCWPVTATLSSPANPSAP